MSTSCITAERLVTPNGTVWTLREVDETGDGRYVPQDVHVQNRLTMERGSRLLGELEAWVAPATQYPSLCVEMGTGPVPRSARLTVGAVQTRTLHDMARMWRETGGEDDISTALTALSDTLHGDSSAETEDAATEAVSDASGLSDPYVELTLEDAIRLRRELDAVIAQMSAPIRRFSTVERAA